MGVYFQEPQSKSFFQVGDKRLVLDPTLLLRTDLVAIWSQRSFSKRTRGLHICKHRFRQIIMKTNNFLLLQTTDEEILCLDLHATSLDFVALYQFDSTLLVFKHSRRMLYFSKFLQ